METGFLPLPRETLNEPVFLNLATIIRRSLTVNGPFGILFRVQNFRSATTAEL